MAKNKPGPLSHLPSSGRVPIWRRFGDRIDEYEAILTHYRELKESPHGAPSVADVLHHIHATFGVRVSEAQFLQHVKNGVPRG